MVKIEASKTFPFSINCIMCNTCNHKDYCSMQSKVSPKLQDLLDLTTDTYHGTFEITIKCNLYINNKGGDIDV